MRTRPKRQMFVLLVMLVLDRTPIGTAQSARPSATALEAAAYRVLGSKHPDQRFETRTCSQRSCSDPQNARS
jgi:hypothetical protein